MPELTITKLQRDEDGFWTARVSINGDTVPVTRRFGVWGTVPEAGRWRPLLTEYAERLQERVRPIEKRERQELEAA